MKTKSIIFATLLLVVTGFFYSCDGLLQTDSSLVIFSEDHQLDQAADSVYSVMGIIYKMQSIADRTVLIGEIKGDLVELTPQASVDLQQLANFNIQSGNKYNTPSDYYAVINNCNYFLANVDTSLEKRNVQVFMKEYAAVKAFRAWTYFQLAKIYGSVPFVTKPILTEAIANKTYPMYNINDMCSFFIEDLTPYLNMDFPGYGAINGMDSKKFFIPIRVLLGDFCLWSDRYVDAARYYHDYLTLEGKEIVTGSSKSSWLSAPSFENWYDNYSNQFSDMGNREIIAYIPMEESAANGVYSELKDIYTSTDNNNYYFEATPSKHLFELSRSQSNCVIYQGITSRDTLFAPAINENHPLWVGDLRLASNYSNQLINQSTSNYSSDRQRINKFNTRHIILYRTNQIYLSFAEALNRAGFPVSAFTILKYGLQPSTITQYIPKSERDSSQNLLQFNQYAFTAENTMGIHGRGCGDVQGNVNYTIPSLPSLSDTVLYVENLICDENALETAFEGYRFFDLLRMAKRRGDATWMADKIAKRKGTNQFDATLNELVKKPENWYLPLK